MSRHFAAGSTIAVWLSIAASLPLQSRADSLVFTASDLPTLASGFKVSTPGEYSVKVFAASNRKWSLKAEGQVLTVSPKLDGSSKGARWSTLGKAKLAADSPVKLSIAPNESDKSFPIYVSLSTSADFEAAKAVDVLRYRADSADPPLDPRRSTVRSNQQGANFKAPGTAQEWRDRAQTVKEQLLVTQGLWPMFPKTEMHPRIYGKTVRDGYTIEKVVLESLPGFYMSGNLYRPIGKTGRLPFVLSPHGHYADGRVNVDVQARCIRWAKLGAVVFMHDMVGYNDSSEFGHGFLNDRLKRYGLSLVTLHTWNSIRALDWAATLPDVDPARIACTGESGGGTQTFFITALDDRIKISAPVVMVSDSFQGGCTCENAAGMRWGSDNVETAALTAPRPLKLVGATGDWTAKTMSNAYPAIREVYSLFGNPDDVSADVFDFPHNYNETSRNAVFAFVAKRLLNLEASVSAVEGKLTYEKPEDLRTFGKDNPRPSDAKTAAQLETELINMIERRLDQLAPGVVSSTWEASRGLLFKALRIRMGAVNPTPFEIQSRQTRRIVRDGVTITHSLVGRKATGEEIAVTTISPSNPSGRVSIVFGPRGKAELINSEGAPAAIVKELLDRGQTVVGFDPLFVGDSVDATSPTSKRPETVHYDTYNASLGVDRLQDLATILAWTRSRSGVREVSLIARGAAGPLALLGRPILEGLARTSIDLDGFDYGDGSAAPPPSLDVPGVLQFGGLKVAAALSAPAPLWIHHAGKSFQRSWPVKGYDLADAAGVLKIDEKPAGDGSIAKWIETGE